MYVKQETIASRASSIPQVSIITDTLFPEDAGDNDGIDEAGIISEKATSIISENATSPRVYKSTIELYAKVCEYCNEYRSIGEISHAVNRSIPHIKSKVIPELLKQERLQRLYPNNPTHTDQKYIATGKEK